MPAKNTVKTYVTDGIYHVYNRGVEKRDIFLDQQDYVVFLRFLKDGLTLAPDTRTMKHPVSVQGRTFNGMARQPKNFINSVSLLAYCLMPNHFHFILQQKDAQNMQEFMQSIMTRYAIYFNNKYKRVGSLLQGKYKAILVGEEPYLLHLSRYIHRNPLSYTRDFLTGYSSYAEYIGLKHTQWVKPGLILSFFTNGTSMLPRQVNTYKTFVESEKIDSENMLGDLTLDD